MNLSWAGTQLSVALTKKLVRSVMDCAQARCFLIRKLFVTRN